AGDGFKINSEPPVLGGSSSEARNDWIDLRRTACRDVSGESYTKVLVNFLPFESVSVQSGTQLMRESSANVPAKQLRVSGEGGACNHCVEIVRRVALSAGHISGTANSETSGRGVHQHRYRAHGVRGPLQLPSRKDWKPRIRPDSHRAWFRGSVD